MESRGNRKRLRLRLRLPGRLRIRRKGQSSPSPGASGVIKSWLGLAWSLFGAVLFVLSALIVTLQVRRDVILIEEFGVPEDLAKQGWTGQAVAKGLLDELQHIQSNATTRMERLPFSSSWSVQSPDVVVAGTSVPLASLVRHLRDLFGVATMQIDGEVMVDGEEILLVARVNGSEGRAFSAAIDERGRAGTIKRLLGSAAKYVLEETQPYLLASFLCNTKDQRCLPTLERCLQNDSIHDDPWAYNMWGIMLSDKRPEEAVAMFQRAIALDPEFDLPYRNWGRLLLDQKKPSEAVAVLERALELRPDAISYSNLGFALLEQKRAPEAFEKLEHAVEMDPRHPNTLLNLGYYHLTRKDTVKALASLREAILLDPNEDQTYELLIPLVQDPAEADRLRNERLRRREHVLRKRVQANPESGTSRCKLALFLESRLRYEEAEAEYRAALEVEDTLAEAHNGLGRILFERNDHAHALVRFQRGAELAPTSDNLLNVGVCLYRLNRLEESLQEFRKALRKSPDPKVVRQKGCVVAKQTGVPEAIQGFCPPNQVRVAAGIRPESSAGASIHRLSLGSARTESPEKPRRGGMR